MQLNPNPSQRLLLWNLVASGGSEWLRSLRPDPKLDLRKPLEEAGLIRVEERDRPEINRRARHVWLTKAGWDWVESQMMQPLGGVDRNPSSAILQKLIMRLEGFMKAGNLSLRDLFAEGEVDHPEFPLPAEADLRDPAPSAPGPLIDSAILRALREQQGRRKPGRLRESDLREQFQLTQEELAASLERLTRRGEIAREPIDETGEAQKSGRAVLEQR